MRLTAAFFGLFESGYTRDRDRIEITRLREQYGEGVSKVIRDRAGNTSLSARDRKHWHRIARKL